MIAFDGYIRWIKFLVKAIGESAKQSAESLIQYEHTTEKDEELLINTGKITRGTSIVYEYFERFPIANIPYASKGTGLSFNSTAKARYSYSNEFKGKKSYLGIYVI